MLVPDRLLTPESRSAENAIEVVALSVQISSRGVMPICIQQLFSVKRRNSPVSKLLQED